MFDVSEYWRLAVKHRLLIAGIFIASITISVVATLLTTPIYTAGATLQIERTSDRVLDVEEVSPREAQVTGEEFFQTQYGLLKSRSLAERVVDSLGLARSDAFIVTMGGTPSEANGRSAADLATRRREAAVGLLMSNFGVSPVRGSRLVNITFDSPDPETASRVVNAYAENFIGSNLDRRFESSLYAREFLEDRIAQTKAKLEDAERQLVAYAAQQQIINVAEPTVAGGEAQSLVSTDLGALNGALAEARAARIAAEEKWRQSRSANILTLPEVLQHPPVQRLLEDRARLDAQYQQNSAIYQPDWPAQQQLAAQIRELDRQTNTAARSVLSSIQGQYQIAANQEQSLQRQVNALKGDVLDLRTRTIDYNILQREVDTSRTLYEGLLQRYKEVGVTGAVASNNISIVDRAKTPGSPSKPQLLLNLVIAGLLGIGLGVLAAFILETLDESLASPDDVETKLGASVLGVIPLLDRGMTPVAALSDVRSPFSEAYYSLRTALQFSTPNGAPLSMLVTSSRPAEGKSSTAYAISLTLARIGKRVLLADGDLRNPSMHRIIGVENELGMSNLLSGSAKLSDVVRQTSEPNLYFIPCGPLPPNPAELWGSQRLNLFFEEAAKDFDHIVVDGPPVLGFADSPVLASAVEGTLFVLESKGTRRAQARGAIRRLLVGNSRLLGVVLTKFNTRTAQYGGYEYAYDYEYGARPEPGAKAGRKGRNL